MFLNENKTNVTIFKKRGNMKEYFFVQKTLHTLCVIYIN